MPAMADVVVYATMFCPFCHRAKKLLKHKGVDFREIDVTMNKSKREEMTKLAGGDHKVPQIWINGEHIGGCDELYALENAGKLDAKLQGDAA
jgi:glutaredoxin 3